jgi:transposase
VETGRRRRWTEDEKLRIVLESLEGARQASATARRYGISRSLLNRWRRSFRPEQRVILEQSVGFVPATVVADAKPPVPAPVGPAEGGTIEIELTTGARVRITGTVDAGTLQATVAALSGRRG